MPGLLGVRGRNSHNRLISDKLWAPSQPLAEGIEVTYGWIKRQLRATRPPKRVRS